MKSVSFRCFHRKDQTAMMNIAFIFCCNIISILAEENSLLVLGGVQKLLFDDYYSSIVTTKGEVVGCIDISVPDYPNPIFGSSLLHFKVLPNAA